jgi:hypothetical protein
VRPPRCVVRVVERFHPAQVRVEMVQDPSVYIPGVLERVRKAYLQNTYGVSEWTDHIDFLTQLANKMGKLLRVCCRTRGRRVIHEDWHTGWRARPDQHVAHCATGLAARQDSLLRPSAGRGGRPGAQHGQPERGGCRRATAASCEDQLRDRALGLQGEINKLVEEQELSGIHVKSKFSKEDLRPAGAASTTDEPMEPSGDFSEEDEDEEEQDAENAAGMDVDEEGSDSDSDAEDAEDADGNASDADADEAPAAAVPPASPAPSSAPDLTLEGLAAKVGTNSDGKQPPAKRRRVSTGSAKKKGKDGVDMRDVEKRKRKRRNRITRSFRLRLCK